MSDQPLCASPRCRLPGRHAEGCDQPTCRGCLPARAADGLRLCTVCARRIGENATRAAELYDDLALVLKAAGRGERSSNKPGSGGPPRDAVVEQRATIRHVLVSWCRLVSEERGISLPGNDTGDLAAYLVRHAEWLAACDYADEVADELAGLASRAYGLAYPSGSRRIRVGPCPRCGGVPGPHGQAIQRLPLGFIGPPNRSGCLVAVVREQDQDKLPSEVACDLVGEHKWDAIQWRQLDREVMAKRRAAA